MPVGCILERGCQGRCQCHRWRCQGGRARPRDRETTRTDSTRAGPKWLAVCWWCNRTGTPSFPDSRPHNNTPWPVRRHVCPPVAVRSAVRSSRSGHPVRAAFQTTATRKTIATTQKNTVDRCLKHSRLYYEVKTGPNGAASESALFT